VPYGPRPGLPSYIISQYCACFFPCLASRHYSVSIFTPNPPVRSLAPLRCVGCSTSFLTLQALCAYLNSSATTCTFTRDDCRVVNADCHLLTPFTFVDDPVGVAALVYTIVLLVTATLHPPNRRHAVLRFCAVGRPRCPAVLAPRSSMVPCSWGHSWGELQSLLRVMPPFLPI
jgi:hypothetical protein